MLTCLLPICMEKFYIFSKYKHLSILKRKLLCCLSTKIHHLLPAMYLYYCYFLPTACTLPCIFTFSLFVLICCLHSACINLHLLPALHLYLLLHDPSSLSHCLLPASVCLLLHVHIAACILHLCFLIAHATAYFLHNFCKI
jgi:hypothetical protein